MSESPTKLRIAYADPPYLGCAMALYGDATYDDVESHRTLLGRMATEFPDGWAYSLSSTSLRTLLPLAPADARVAAWVKPFASFKPGVNPAYAWEPVIFWGGRRRTDGAEPTVRDWCACNITLRRNFTGAKPEAFCWWLFDLMGLRRSDEFVDLFPGSGAVGRAWESFTSQRLFA